jgi:hypothetical protein
MVKSTSKDWLFFSIMVIDTFRLPFSMSDIWFCLHWRYWQMLDGIPYILVNNFTFDQIFIIFANCKIRLAPTIDPPTIVCIVNVFVNNNR